jgi:hypothetical protein
VLYTDPSNRLATLLSKTEPVVMPSKPRKSTLILLLCGALFASAAYASRVIFIIDWTGEICGAPGYCYIDEKGNVIPADD